MAVRDSVVVVEGRERTKRERLCFSFSLASFPTAGGAAASGFESLVTRSVASLEGVSVADGSFSTAVPFAVPSTESRAFLRGGAMVYDTFGYWGRGLFLWAFRALETFAEKKLKLGRL